jgi:hypothetical protein
LLNPAYLVHVQLPLDARLALYHKWGLEVVPHPGSAAASSLDFNYQCARLLCNTSTQQELRTLLQQVAASWAPFSALPDSALQHIFQLLCDSCQPEVPGTCWLAPVCKQWRELAGSVKGLRVLFQSDPGPAAPVWQTEHHCSPEQQRQRHQQRVASLCAWLRRHAGQVKAFATVTCAVECDVLATLASAAAAAAAAAGVEGPPAVAAAAARKPLPLQRLVILDSVIASLRNVHSFQVLVTALPDLRHLHMPCWLSASGWDPDVKVQEAAAAALAPLQHTTSLTSLVLDGLPWLNTGVCAQDANSWPSFLAACAA